MHRLRLHLYSAGRLHLGHHHEPWHTEFFSETDLFRWDVQHNGHVNVTAVQPLIEYDGPYGQIHNMSGLNPRVQAQMVADIRFTECLILLHERLKRSVSDAFEDGNNDVHFVISCNGGFQQSVAVAEIMQCILNSNGWQNIEVEHLHLWGCLSPRVPNACCRCEECWWPEAIATDTESMASQQWRAVCC